MSLRFIQLGDTHLGAALTGVIPEIAEKLRQATRAAVEAAFTRAVQHKAGLLLLTGDLFEAGSTAEAELRFIYELIHGVAPLPVVITPGNHDAYGPDSAYAKLPLPGNASLFTSGAFSVIETAAGFVAGRAVCVGEGANAIDWSQLPPPPSETALLVLHASVLHAEDERRQTQLVAPVSSATLERTGYSYTALGHYHTFQQWRRPQQQGALAYAAYAGCPQGLGWDEPGLKGFIQGELGPAGAKLEFIASSRHVIQRQRLVLPPEYTGDPFGELRTAQQRLLAELDPADFLDLSVSGRWPALWRSELEQQLAELTAYVTYARSIQYSGVQFSPPLVGPGESVVLDEVLRRCDEQIGSGMDTEAWQLARYLAHRLLSGQGLPQEVV